MERILLIGDETFGISFFKTKVYKEDIKSYSMSAREVQIRRGDEVLKLETVDNMINEYAQEEREKIPYESPKILMASFSDKKLFLDIVQEESFPKGLVIDDLEKIMTFEEYMKKM